MDSAASLSYYFAISDVEANFNSVAFLGFGVVFFGHDVEDYGEVLTLVYGEELLFVRAEKHIVADGIQSVYVASLDSQFDHVVTPDCLDMQDVRLPTDIR